MRRVTVVIALSVLLIFFAGVVSAAECNLLDKIFGWFGFGKCAVLYSPPNTGEQEQEPYTYFGAENGYCGDGIIKDPEECEGNDLRGRNCRNLGYDGGTLECNSDCTLNVANCKTNSCEDSDDGQNSNIFGSVQTFSYNEMGEESSHLSEDECVNPDEVLEFYCEGNSPNNLTIECGEGYRCNNGACEAKINCNDGDGGMNKNSARICVDSEGTHKDSCISGKVLEEWFCSENICESQNDDVEMCDNGAAGFGKCVSNKCVFVNGSGTNECAVINESCGNDELEFGNNQSASGTLYLNSTPEKASVYDNGVLQGVSPLVYNASATIHSIKFVKTGYLPYFVNASVQAGQTTKINVVLVELQADMPDLRINKLEEKVGKYYGGLGYPVTISATIINSGNGNASKSLTKFLIEESETNKSVKSLASGEEVNVSTTIYVNSMGRHFVAAFADFRNEVNETNELNNNLSKTFSIAETSCEDSDGGMEYYSAGETSNAGTTEKDFCKSSLELVEFYCSGDDVINSTISCQTKCEEGQCVKESGESEESDATQPLSVNSDEGIWERIVKLIKKILGIEK